MAVTGTARAVTLTLGTADRDLARSGRTVMVVLPGGASVEGRIGSAVRAAAGGGPTGDTNQLSVTIDIADQAKVADLEDSPVDVNFVVGERRDVLIVPVLAILALREGGFGVEIVDGDGSRIVPVQVGLFAQGKVEINGGGVSAGMSVVVPS
jgi:multidrug efflux pump subunit AcrA (membrane-fusion protein)